MGSELKANFVISGFLESDFADGQADSPEKWSLMYAYGDAVARFHGISLSHIPSWKGEVFKGCNTHEKLDGSRMSKVAWHTSMVFARRRSVCGPKWWSHRPNFPNAPTFRRLMPRQWRSIRSVRPLKLPGITPVIRTRLMRRIPMLNPRRLMPASVEDPDEQLLSEQLNCAGVQWQRLLGEDGSVYQGPTMDQRQGRAHI